MPAQSTTADQLILSLAGRRMRYTKPSVIFHRIDTDGRDLLVVGGPDGAYEWVLLNREGAVHCHSDCGYGSQAAAMRDGLIDVLGIPSFTREVISV